MWWEKDFPDWPIVEGYETGNGPFNRAMAVNDAADKAGDWDAAVIIDSDVISNAHAVRTGVDLAVSTGLLVVNHDERIMLNRSTTEKIINGYRGSWRERGMYETIWNDSVSCSISVSRKLWDAIGGMDELFVGWGFEDTAFRCAAETVSDKQIIRVSSEAWHLWHTLQPHADKQGRATNPNHHRKMLYQNARWKRDEMQALLTEAMDARLHMQTSRIPRIIFRTVPAEINAQVEDWWHQFRKLHRGWKFITYREPLIPSEWLLTSEAWHKCKNGAQKAGLIRLEALVRHGGVYVDSDVIPHKSFEPLMNTAAFAAWEDEDVIPDAVMACEPGHDTFKRMLDAAIKQVMSGADAWASGPGVSTSHLANDPDVLVLPPGAFYPHHYLEKNQAGKKVGPWTFCEHMWQHSWGTAEQKARILKAQRA